jgi:hypothetical protein
MQGVQERPCDVPCRPRDRRGRMMDDQPALHQHVRGSPEGQALRRALYRLRNRTELILINSDKN